MKTTPRPDGRRSAVGADEVEIQPPSSPPFVIRDLQRVAYGSKRATFTIEVCDGAVTINADLFMPETNPAFITPASTRSSYTGRYERHARLDDTFAAEVLEVVLVRLAVDDESAVT